LAISDSALLDWALSAELIHSASLIHDDIVDESNLRREAPTLHISKGSGWAVLAGDLLLAEALQMIEKHGPAAIHAATTAVSALTKAAIEEIDFRPKQSSHPTGISNASFSETKKIAAGKTGALFGYCLAAGPTLANDLSTAARQFQAGVHLGTAYQFRDDLIDLIGEEGKPRGSDLREGNPNAYIALVREHGQITPEILEEISLSNWDRAADALLKLNRRAELLDQIKKEVELAIAHLGQLEGEHPFNLLFESLRKYPTYD
jgi:geranylgeranyl pyrophosphate synthase